MIFTKNSSKVAKEIIKKNGNKLAIGRDLSCNEQIVFLNEIAQAQVDLEAMGIISKRRFI